MVMRRLLWEPLPESWPAAPPPRPSGLRSGLARVLEIAGRPRRAATQTIVRKAYQQVLT
ncbi:hypothetical protein ACTMTI_43225 [Nonomuraea sp. H19]|uniref:hypothetical protein n=1 Tax=Nonomuraea sp. H19 TaxID=3452206 RepID=UPI003F8A3B9A